MSISSSRGEKEEIVAKEEPVVINDEPVVLGEEPATFEGGPYTKPDPARTVGGLGRRPSRRFSKQQALEQKHREAKALVKRIEGLAHLSMLVLFLSNRSSVWKTEVVQFPRLERREE